ncbi:hypothetical protein SAMN05421810_102136 [Amycolatopsis arida]|uniref:N-acetyltransferase domain-containing protein n=1 Tax=Amycolatopsis arida TaxID=587909 RepID=A0A1I5P5B7_9PSEU|nr:hypothetical protein [Amycolatopsis arida]TDX98344.1 hypothetical protein CLV69_101136 [Amycolatopsis arida]SFP28676.1 hypothetical protein SAMN05421810_102136 [Amycolatopsis arida]
MNPWTIRVAPMDDPDAVAVLHLLAALLPHRRSVDARRSSRGGRYFVDVASSYDGRSATAAEVDAALAEDPSDDLVLPTGLFLLGHHPGTVPGDHDGPGGGEVRGRVGVRVRGAGATELTRMYVEPAARGIRRRPGTAPGGRRRRPRARRQGGAPGTPDPSRILWPHSSRLRSSLAGARSMLGGRRTALYIRHGYVEIPAYSHAPYAEHWYEKAL